MGAEAAQDVKATAADTHITSASASVRIFFMISLLKIFFIYLQDVYFSPKKYVKDQAKRTKSLRIPFVRYRGDKIYRVTTLLRFSLTG
jgi:hypothetical protein